MSPAKKSLIVGVLGGMGPDASIDFMAKMLAATPAEVDEDHIRMLIDHNPVVPNRQVAILSGQGDPGSAIAEMARGLEASGADFLTMPCNTAHVYQADIEAVVSIPLLSIIDVTIAACGEQKKVGLLSTAACLHSEIYQRAFSAMNTDVVLQDAAELDKFTQLIARIKKGDKSQVVSEAMRSLAMALVDQGAETVVAACTEIPLVLRGDALPVALISSTDLLAEAAVAVALGKRIVGDFSA